MLTLNRLIAEIETFKENHKFLKTWIFGDSNDVNAVHDIQYPLLFGFVKPSPIQGTSESFIIEFYACDRPGINERGSTEALSDTKQIINDLLSYFAGAEFSDDFQINKDEGVTIEPFAESFKDNVWGWSAEVKFTTPFEWDLCSVPVTGYPAVTDPDAAYIIDQNNNLVATLNPGQVFSVTNLTDTVETYTVTGTTQTILHTPSFIYGVFMNGQRLTLTTDYTISGTTITFVTALASDSITIVYSY